MAPASPATLKSLLQTVNVASRRIILPATLELEFTPAFPRLLLDGVAALNPFVTSFWLTIFLGDLQLFLSVITRSITWNDRAWSLIPPVYALLYLVHAPMSNDGRTDGQPDIRVCLISLLIFSWAVRLTIHATTRGVYSRTFVGDYRYFWILQNVFASTGLISFSSPVATIGSMLFLVVYATVVCFGFTGLLAIASAGPLHAAWVARGDSVMGRLNALDALAFVISIAALSIESIADRQQQQFQRVKMTTPTDPSVRDGFCQTGLFARCRHPNFFGEMAFWTGIHIFSIAAGASALNWTAIAPLGYVLVFLTSTTVTERISASKYKAYAAYQERVPRFWPLLRPRPPRPSTSSIKQD